MRVDLRSDTVTKPSTGMREAMAKAEVGDDVFQDDPTVIKLERQVALLLEQKAALFFPSGTQSNLAALMTHCQRGDEVLVGQGAHTFSHEGGGAAVLGSIQPQPLEQEPDGTLSFERLEAAIKPRDDHYPRTKLLALENTFNGRELPLAYLEQATSFAKQHGLSTHLDGARLFNAAVKQGVPVGKLARGFDSVTVCLSKGLGAPVGSVLAGTPAFIVEARRWRKMLGGGLRQVGILAAAGLYALEHHVPRLADDHANAALLASSLEGLKGVRVEPVFTNMVWLHLDGAEKVVAELAKRGVLATGHHGIRLVTHLDVSKEQVLFAAQVLREVLQAR